MPKGPRGEWRPRDDRACSVHVAKVLTGEIEETFEAPADEAPAPGPGRGRGPRWRASPGPKPGNRRKA